MLCIRTSGPVYKELMSWEGMCWEGGGCLWCLGGNIFNGLQGKLGRMKKTKCCRMQYSDAFRC